jgi:hypothetical protein
MAATRIDEGRMSEGRRLPAWGELLLGAVVAILLVGLWPGNWSRGSTHRTVVLIVLAVSVPAVLARRWRR